MPRRNPPRHSEPAPLDSDSAGTIRDPIDSARMLETEMPGNHKLLVSQLLGEVRRILRRGDPEP